jgi:hypothetical protein
MGKKKKLRSEVSSPVVMVINTSSNRWRRHVAGLGNMINANNSYKHHLGDLTVN